MTLSESDCCPQNGNDKQQYLGITILSAPLQSMSPSTAIVVHVASHGLSLRTALSVHSASRQPFHRACRHLQPLSFTRHLDNSCRSPLHRACRHLRPLSFTRHLDSFCRLSDISRSPSQSMSPSMAIVAHAASQEPSDRSYLDRQLLSFT